MPLTVPARITARLVFCALLALNVRAYAEPSPDNQQHEADRLFEEGLESMRAGKYETACPKLSDSYRIDPSPGALFTLAECEAGWRKLASALSDYQGFISALTSMPAERRDTFEERRRIAVGQIAVLNVSAPEITVDVAPNHDPNLVVKFNGAVIPEASYGVGRRVDPGSYSGSAELDGKTVWRRDITVEADSRAHIQVQPAARSTPAPNSAPVAASSHRTWLYVSGGVAIAGVATGLIAGALAYGHKSNIDRNCPDLQCNPAGRSAVNTARSEARVGTVSFTVGIAGAAAALALLVWAPHATEPTSASASKRFHVDLGGDSRSLRLTGQF